MSENVMTLQVITPAGMIYDHHANTLLLELRMVKLVFCQKD